MHCGVKFEAQTNASDQVKVKCLARIIKVVDSSNFVLHRCHDSKAKITYNPREKSNLLICIVSLTVGASGVALDHLSLSSLQVKLSTKQG